MPVDLKSSRKHTQVGYLYAICEESYYNPKVSLILNRSFNNILTLNNILAQTFQLIQLLFHIVISRNYVVSRARTFMSFNVYFTTQVNMLSELQIRFVTVVKILSILVNDFACFRYFGVFDIE